MVHDMLAESERDRSPVSRNPSARVVQLQYGRALHPMFHEQLHAVPPGFRYVSAHPALADDPRGTKLITQSAGRLPRVQRLAERIAMRALSSAGYVHTVGAEPLGDAELIHSCERLLRRPPLPYVLDFEHVELFVLYQRAALSRPWTRRWLLSALGDERCRRLLPWTEAARRSVFAALGPEAERQLGPRMEVLHPAVRLAAEHPRLRQPGPLRVLFVGTVFLEKGGVEAIRAVERARESHDVELDVLSYVPPDWQRRLDGASGVRIHRPGAPDVVRRLYERCDVLLFPSHMDTFGFVVLEAMAHGLPVLAPRHLALTEIVEDERSGLLFAPENMMYGADTRSRFQHVLPPPARYLCALAAPSDPYVAGIAAALARLAGDGDLYGQLAAGAHQRVRSGLFSIEERKRRLERIYADALE